LQLLKIGTKNLHPDVLGPVKVLFGRLNEAKASLHPNPESDAHECEEFATALLEKAKRVDKAGRADKTTAITFFAASFYLQILDQFQQLELPSIMAKAKYAAWRASEINKAVKAGVPPPPPPEEADMSVQEEAVLLGGLSSGELVVGSVCAGNFARYFRL
jgi:hypothetical protein